jgi:hypothetical protein
MDAAGENLYVLGYTAGWLGTVTMYRRDPVSGTLTEVDTLVGSADGEPFRHVISLVVAATGEHAYAIQGWPEAAKLVVFERARPTVNRNPARP